MFELDRNSSTPLYRQIADAIRGAVESGRLSGGEKLPARLALVDDLKVNLATVRTAFELLEAEGLIVSKSGSGTYVREDALTAVRRPADRRLGAIVIVIDKDHISEFHRDRLDIILNIVAGMEQVLGINAGPYVYVRALDEPTMRTIENPGIVLLHRTKGIVPGVLEELRQRKVPVMKIWSNDLDLDVPCVWHDTHRGTALACHHLIDCGYRRMGYIGDMGSNTPIAAKFFGFTSALFEAGLDYQVRHVRQVTRYPGEAYQAASAIVKDDVPDAFFVDTDWRALEVICALKHAGLRVPEDVGVIGHDDIVEAREFEPGLTTVRTPRVEIGRVVARQWLDWVERGTEPHTELLDPSLIVRGTTRKLAAALDEIESDTESNPSSATR